MHIVHVANVYGRRSHLSAPMLAALGTGYSRAGHRFTAIVPGPVAARRTNMAGTVLTVPAPVRMRGRLSFAKTEALILDELRRLSPDVLEIAERSGSGILTRWARDAGVPTVLIISGAPRTASEDSDTFRRTALDHITSDRIVHISPTHSFTRNDASGRVCIVRPGIDLAEFTPLRWSESIRDRHLDGEDTLLAYVGRFDVRHEPHHALETVRRLRERGAAVRLLMIGTGPLERRLRADSTGLAVDFVDPAMNPREYARYLATVDTVLLPGRQESVVTRGLESLASGTPVVFAEGSPVREIAGSHGGEAATGENGSYAGAVERILARRVDDRRINARERASRYPSQSTVDGLLAVHHQLHYPLDGAVDPAREHLISAGDRPTPSGAIPS